MASLFPGIQTKGHTRETSAQQQGKGPKPFERLPLGLLVRAMIGQMVNPPNTAISVPTQQALSNLQGGAMGMANAYGIGGRPNMQTGGLQSRAEMGLPDRSSYFGPFMPTNADIQSLGMPPLPVTTADPNVKARRKEARGSKGGRQAERGGENRARTPGE